MAKKIEKLIPSGYAWPHDCSPARRQFFLAIQRLAPEVLKKRHDALPVHRRVGNKTGRHRNIPMAACWNTFGAWRSSTT